MTSRARTGMFLFVAGVTFAQIPPASPTFEVASVKRDPSGGNGGEIRQLHGSFNSRNSTLQALIRYAYNVADYQIQGPGWMGTERYDITAKFDVDADNRAVRLMLQKLLAERFGLLIRHDVKQLPVYALMVAKGGAKLVESKPADSTAVASTNHSIKVNRATLPILATALSGQMDRPVIDATGLPGTFDINIEWTPESAGADSAPSGPSVFTALQDRLGLRLESRTGPVDVLVVDHAEKIPSDN